MKDTAVKAMFETIAPSYDFQNSFLSLRRDIYWRRTLADILQPEDDSVILDVAVGEILVDVAGSEATLNLQLETSDDLNIWSNAGPAKVWTWTVDGEKKFPLFVKLT